MGATLFVNFLTETASSLHTQSSYTTNRDLHMTWSQIVT